MCLSVCRDHLFLGLSNGLTLQHGVELSSLLHPQLQQRICRLYSVQDTRCPIGYRLAGCSGLVQAGAGAGELRRTGRARLERQDHTCRLPPPIRLPLCLHSPKVHPITANIHTPVTLLHISFGEKGLIVVTSHFGSIPLLCSKGVARIWFRGGTHFGGGADPLFFALRPQITRVPPYVLLATPFWPGPPAPPLATPLLCR